MAQAPIPLADIFPPAERGDWLTLVTRTLKGASPETLDTRTVDGILIRSLFDGASGIHPRLDFSPRRERAWDVRAPVNHPQVAKANVQALEALGGGASSVCLALDPSGEMGVAVGGPEDLARLLEGVEIDIAGVALDAGFLGATAADWLSAAAKASPAARLDFHLDPLGAFAKSGASPGPIAAHLAGCAAVGARLARAHPLAGIFLADGCAVHEAGGSEATELAFAVASALAYARTLETGGMEVGEAFARVKIALAADGKPLISIAKLRAMRILWRRITQACGVQAPARIESRSSRRMLVRVAPWSNLVRLTCAAFAAVVGGADTVMLGAFTDALGRPAALARRMARNTQLIVMEEAQLGRTRDPAGDAYAFEALSADLANAAWARLQEIEAAGGAAAALCGGLVAAWVAEGREDLRSRIAAGEMKIVGVTAFARAAAEAPALDTATPVPAPAPDPRLPGNDDFCPLLPAVSLEDLAA